MQLFFQTPKQKITYFRTPPNKNILDHHQKSNFIFDHHQKSNCNFDHHQQKTGISKTNREYNCIFEYENRYNTKKMINDTKKLIALLTGHFFRCNFNLPTNLHNFCNCKNFYRMQKVSIQEGTFFQAKKTLSFAASWRY